MSLIPETKFRIIQQLDEEPMHGYALAKNLGISHGYIYTHLKELREEGMIEVEEIKDNKKVYRLTESGELLVKALE